MSITKIASIFAGDGRTPVSGKTRRLVAAALTAASQSLLQLAEALLAPPPLSPRTLPRVEFHAEAGALDGALYVDGILVGRLPGVRRL